MGLLSPRSTASAPTSPNAYGVSGDTTSPSSTSLQACAMAQGAAPNMNFENMAPRHGPPWELPPRAASSSSSTSHQLRPASSARCSWASWRKAASVAKVTLWNDPTWGLCWPCCPICKIGDTFEYGTSCPYCKASSGLLDEHLPPENERVICDLPSESEGSDCDGEEDGALDGLDDSLAWEIPSDDECCGLHDSA